MTPSKAISGKLLEASRDTEIPKTVRWVFNFSGDTAARSFFEKAQTNYYKTYVKTRKEEQESHPVNEVVMTEFIAVSAVFIIRVICQFTHWF